MYIRRGTNSSTFLHQVLAPTILYTICSDVNSFQFERRLKLSTFPNRVNEWPYVTNRHFDDLLFFDQYWETSIRRQFSGIIGITNK